MKKGRKTADFSDADHFFESRVHGSGIGPCTQNTSRFREEVFIKHKIRALHVYRVHALADAPDSGLDNSLRILAEYCSDTSKTNPASELDQQSDAGGGGLREGLAV